MPHLVVSVYHLSMDAEALEGSQMDAGDQESNSTRYYQGTLTVAIVHRVREALSRDGPSSHK